MSRNIADRLRSLDVKAGFSTPAAEAVTPAAAAAAKPGPARARGGESGPQEPPGPPEATRKPRKPAAAVRPPDTPTERPGRGRPPRHEEPTQQTTIRLTMAEWAALQAQVTKETLERGERRYVVDIIRDAINAYLADRG